MAIVQNAIKVIEDGKETYLISRHRHDFQSYKFKNGKTIFTDGGTDYIRRGGTFFPEDANSWEDWSLDDKSTTKEIAERLLWGTRGLSENIFLTFLPLNVLETDHLDAILKTQKQISKLYSDVIKYILKERKKKVDKKLKKV